MGTKEAMQILCEGINKLGKIYGTNATVEITPTDIRTNLECNDYTLNLEWIQDFIRIDKTTRNAELYQGHSLGEVDFD